MFLLILRSYDPTSSLLCTFLPIFVPLRCVVAGCHRNVENDHAISNSSGVLWSLPKRNFNSCYSVMLMTKKVSLLALKFHFCLKQERFPISWCILKLKKRVKCKTDKTQASEGCQGVDMCLFGRQERGAPYCWLSQFSVERILF